MAAPALGKKGSTTFRIAGYNILAQCLAKSSYFTFAEKATLKWANRSKALGKQLVGLGDILCLSEVDNVPHWRAALEPEFTMLHQLRGSKQYGNVIAFRTSRFRLVDAASCNFDDIASVADASDLHRRSCVAVFAALQPLPLDMTVSGVDPELLPLVIVASTHLFWDPSLPPVRAAQAGMLQLCLSDFTSRAYAQIGRTDIFGPVIIAGDLNSLPGSVAHNMLTRLPLPSLWALSGEASPPLWSSGWDLTRVISDTSGSSGFPPFLASSLEAVPKDALLVISKCRHAWLQEVASRLPGWLEHATDSNKALITAAFGGEDAAARTTTSTLLSVSSDVSACASGTGGVMPMLKPLSMPFRASVDQVILRSAYSWKQFAGLHASYEEDCAAEPFVTTATESFRGAIDYVLVSRPPVHVRGEQSCPHVSWDVVSVGDLPCPRTDVVPMPNPSCPSDHFPVSADILLEWW